MTDFNVSKNDNTFEAVLARMTALDGLPFWTFIKSKDLRECLVARGFKIPSSENTLRCIVLDYSKKIRLEVTKAIQQHQNKNRGLSLTFDEWSSTSNKHFMNINVHGQNIFWNIGLIRIKNSMSATACLETLKTRLKEHKLSLSDDIVSVTTDGASTMIKVGKLISPHQQLCFAHGIQLAVVDVLYKKCPNNIEHEDVHENSNDALMVEAGDDEEILDEYGEEDDEEDCAGTGLQVLKDYDDNVDISLNYDLHSTISKVRKIIKSFRKSPTKNDILQKYVKEEFGKELKLILDCKTRWSSLFLMLKRFGSLQNCVQKAMIDLKMPLLLDSEFQLVDDLVKLLEPLKVTVEALCLRDANLCTSDAALKFMLEQVKKVDTRLSVDLYEALRVRIAQRRTYYSGIIRYLHNPNEQESDALFNIPNQKVIREVLANLIKRLQKIPNVTIEEDDGEDNIPLATLPLLQPQFEANKSLEEKLNEALENAMNPIRMRPHIDLVSSTLKKEMTLFENGGSRGTYLQLAYNFLMSIPPTSVESERAFSAAGTLCTKIRSRLGDNTLNELIFLRNWFSQQL